MFAMEGEKEEKVPKLHRLRVLNKCYRWLEEVCCGASRSRLKKLNLNFYVDKAIKTVLRNLFRYLECHVGRCGLHLSL